MKNRIMFGVLFFFVLSINSFSQPNLSWVKIYNGGSLEFSKKMVRDVNGNFIGTGSSVVSDPGWSNYGILTIKYDPSGNTLWTAVKDNSANATDEPTSLILDKDNNIITAGYYGQYMILVKYDESGNELWFHAFNPGYDYTLTDQLCTDGSGNIYYTGSSPKGQGLWQPFVRKYSADGNLAWDKNFDLGGYQRLVYDGNTNFYIVGSPVPEDSIWKCTVIKFDTSGSIIWKNNFGTNGDLYYQPLKLILDSDQNFYVLGSYGDYYFQQMTELFKCDSSGTLIWDKLISDTSNVSIWPSDICLDSRDNIYMSGYKGTFASDGRLLTMRFNPDGDIIWEKSISDSNRYSNGEFLGIDADNNVYNFGLIQNLTFPGYRTTFAVKYDSLGVQQWRLNNGYITDHISASIVNADDDFTLFFTDDGANYKTTRYSNNPIKVTEFDRDFSFELKQNYPNPFNPVTKISYSLSVTSYVILKIFDILSNEITTLVDKQQTPGAYTAEFDGSNLSSGVYFYKIISGNHSEVKKMMLLR